MPKHTFTKEERLKSKKILSRLFTEGKSLNSYPIRVVWLPIVPPNTKAPFQFALSVPRKNFPKSVHRNKIKRQVREAYRLHKYLLYDTVHQKAPELQFGLMLIYIAKDQLPYTPNENSVKKIIKRLSSEFSKS